MIDWTDRHCRYFHRQISRNALLYTEMVVADAIIHGPRERLLSFDRRSIRWRCSLAVRIRQAGEGGGDRRALWLRRDQPQCRLPLRPGAVRHLRRLPDADAGDGGGVHRGDEGGVRCRSR
jgi:hypothetical protein